MNELDRFIKEINLVFTNTIQAIDFCRVDFDLETQKVNYENAINIYKLVSSFNKLYKSFKKEYDSLEKLELGNHLQILGFSDFNINNDYYRSLTIDILDPLIINKMDPSICACDYTVLYICEKNNNIYCFITNDINPFNKDYYKKEIKLDDTICKKYLDLFEKYKLLLEVYKCLKNKFVYGDGMNVLFTKIDGNFLNELTGFEVSFGQGSFNTNYYVNLYLNLVNNLNIDIDKCKIILDSKQIAPNEEIINKFINEVHINKKYLKRK